MEENKFEFTNKILRLENDLVQREVERDKYYKAATNAKARLHEVETERKDLADEYITLKTNYLQLTKDHKSEMAKVDELSMELLNLVNAKAILMKQVENLENAHAGQPYKPISQRFGDPDREINRIKAMLGRVTHRKYNNVDDMKPDPNIRNQVESDLMGTKRAFEAEIDRIHNIYDAQQGTLDVKLQELMKELQETRAQNRDKTQKISELNAQLITAKGNHQELQHQLNKVQNRMKEVNDDYKSRLNKWIEDIAEYVDSGAGLPGKKASPEKYRDYVDRMLVDLKKGHKFREEQLSDAAQGFRKKAIDTVKKHEQLLIAYRNLRQMAEQRGLSDDDMGPDETHFYITDDDLVKANVLEMKRVKEKNIELESEIEAYKARLGLSKKKRPGEIPACSTTVIAALDPALTSLFVTSTSTI